MSLRSQNPVSNFVRGGQTLANAWSMLLQVFKHMFKGGFGLLPGNVSGVK